MLKVRARRTCLHGAGVATKPKKVSVKSKGFKKVLLSSYIQDGNLITSAPDPQKQELLKRTSPQAEEAELATPLDLQRTNVYPEGSPHPASQQDDGSIFSPNFHQITILSGHVGQNPLKLDASTLQLANTGTHTAGSHLSTLTRCSSSAAVSAKQPAEAESDSLQGDWEVDTTCTDDPEVPDFDPYLFIKRLPRLEDVVPPFRPQLLPKQTRRCPSKTLVLDLDETLVHSTMDISSEADFTFLVEFNNHEHTVYVRLRPHLHEFLDRVSELFEVIVFTASQSVYADKLLNILDPKRQRIHHRAFRDSCVFVEGNYLKDLTILGRDLSKLAIIDNSPQAFGFQIDNGIPIESWFDNKQDHALLELLPFLESLVHVDDVRTVIAEKYRLRAKVENTAMPGSKKYC